MSEKDWQTCPRHAELFRRLRSNGLSRPIAETLVEAIHEGQCGEEERA